MITRADATLYPLRTVDRDLVSLSNLVYESLVVLDDARRPVPGLAESWQMLANGKSWVFTLRDGVRFHDGRPLTAYDVAATMDQIKAIAKDDSIPANEKGLYAGLVDYATSWQADDARNLRVSTDKSGYLLLYAMTFPVLQAQSIFTTNPPGTGPYRVDLFIQGESLWLSGNENWWGRTPVIAEIMATWYPNDKAALTAFEREEVDIILSRSPQALRYRGTTFSGANSYDFSTRQLEVLLMNNNKLLNTVGMRQAIAYAINKPRLVTGVYQGLATQTESIVSTHSFLYNSGQDMRIYEYNVDKANALLDELGWQLKDDTGIRFRRTESGNQSLTFRFGYYDEADTALRREAMLEIQGMLEAVGIGTTVTTYTVESAFSKLRVNVRDYDLFLAAINFSGVPDPTFLLSSNGDCNFVAYRSTDMSTLLKDLYKASDEATFKAVWDAIQLRFAEDIPFIPLYFRDGVVLTRYAYSQVRDIREYELLRSIEHAR